jgi:hypothetical protein
MNQNRMLYGARCALAGALLLLPTAQAGACDAQEAGPKAAAQQPADPNHRVVGATDIYFGVTSADAIREQHHGRDAESMMHGAIPRGRDFYHMTVALFDRNTRQPIVDARVAAHLLGPGEAVKMLEPMVLNDTVSYGNYFRLPGNDGYTLALTITVPGTPAPIETQFRVPR